jgi:hypothetical protein
MKKTILFTVIVILYSIETFGQSSSNDSVEKIDFFKTESIIVRNIFHSFSDSCIKILNCSSPQKLKIIASANFVQNGEIYIRANRFIDKDYIVEIKRLVT